MSMGKSTMSVVSYCILDLNIVQRKKSNNSRIPWCKIKTKNKKLLIENEEKIIID